MSSSDGMILGTTKIVDHGPDAARFALVILGDGYHAAEMSKFHTDVDNFVNELQITPPFDDLWCAINVFRVDVSSTDSGADDPLTCADGSTGSGATPKTYFDSTFCGSSGVRRGLTCDKSSAQSVAAAQVPAVDMTMVIVNSSQYGGTGGSVATFSTHASAAQIGVHEMGHTAFGFADEYESLAGCSSGETGHDNYTGPEPSEPNVTKNTNSATIKWNAELTNAGDPLPTTSNANCAQCDPQGNPRASDYVGAYEGAYHFHCGCYRPSFDCYMRNLDVPFCAVCRRVIRNAMAAYMPAPVTLTWANPPNIVYGTPLGVGQLNASAPVSGTFTYSPPLGTCLSAGVYILSVLFEPADFGTFCFAKTTAMLTVDKATPIINWDDSDDIDFGTPLSDTQLNATASWIDCTGVSVNVFGTFTYTPDKPTMLPIGLNQALKVDFVPSDSANYNNATKTVHINVLTGKPIVTSVFFNPTTFPQEDRTKVTIMVKNDSVNPHSTQGPNPGFEYSEGDTYETKGFPSVAGAYRIAVDLLDSPYKKAKLYRWGFGHTLAPGEVVAVNGYIRFHNSRENGQYYVAMIEEVDNILVDHLGTTGITVLRP